MRDDSRSNLIVYTGNEVIAPVRLVAFATTQAAKYPLANRPAGMLPCVMFFEFPQPNSTREALLQAAFREMHEKGYSGMSLASVCHSVGVSKGAFFHHFRSKKHLGLSVVKELLVKIGFKAWIKPLKENEDPIEAILYTIRLHQNKATAYEIRFGCPLQNWIQEMSPLDEEFRMALSRIFEGWLNEITEHIEEGKRKGYVSKTIESSTIALQIVSQFYGAITLSKSFRSQHRFIALLELLAEFVQSIAPQKRKEKTKAQSVVRQYQ